MVLFINFFFFKVRKCDQRLYILNTKIKGDGETCKFMYYIVFIIKLRANLK